MTELFEPMPVLDVALVDRLHTRLAAWKKSPPKRDLPLRGYARLFEESVLQADQGCDFDFLLRDGNTDPKP